MEIQSSTELIAKTKEAFDKQDPLYRLPEEFGDRHYYTYLMEDAACEVLLDEPLGTKDPDFSEKILVLSEAAKSEMKNYELVLKMRFSLQQKLNQVISIETVDQQR